MMSSSFSAGGGRKRQRGHRQQMAESGRRMMAEEVKRYSNRIDEWVKRRGYTLFEIERGTGIPQRTLSDYRKGRTEIPEHRLEKLARFLECRLADLVEAKQPPSISSLRRPLPQQKEDAPPPVMPPLERKREVNSPEGPSPFHSLTTPLIQAIPLLHKA